MNVALRRLLRDADSLGSSREVLHVLPKFLNFCAGRGRLVELV